MSGALAAPEWKDSEMGTWQLVPLSLHAAFGAEGAPPHAANSLPVLLEQSKGPLPFLYLDCGTEDGLLEANRKFADLLQSKKIPHEYRERPGIHDWIEWDHQVREVLALVAEKLHLSWCDDNGLCAPGQAGTPLPSMLRISAPGPGAPPPPSRLPMLLPAAESGSSIGDPAGVPLIQRRAQRAVTTENGTIAKLIG
jgi:hypothetical protein